MQNEKENDPIPVEFMIQDLEDSTPTPSDDLARFKQKMARATGQPAFAQAAALDKQHVSTVDDLGASMTEFLEGDTRAIDRILHINSPRRERPEDGRKTRFDLDLTKASGARLAGLRDWVLRMLQEGETIQSLATSAERADPETAEEIRGIGKDLQINPPVRAVYAT